MKANTNEYLMSEARKALAKQGGEATKKKHGIEHYKAMSKKGVEARKVKANKFHIGEDALLSKNCITRKEYGNCPPWPHA